MCTILTFAAYTVLFSYAGLPVMAVGNPFQYIGNTAKQDAEAFETGFPKKEFYRNAEIADTLFFTRLKQQLDVYRGESHAFLFHLYTEPVDHANFNKGNIETLMCLGEGAARFLEIKDTSVASISKMIGTHVMGRIHHELVAGLESGKYDISDQGVETMATLLKKNAFPITVKASDSEKLWYHIGNGNWSYIWNRFITRYLNKLLIYVLLPISILLNINLIRKARNRNKKKEMK